MTEILAPAGDEKSAYAALNAGADAVYLGLTRFSAREGAENFSVSALEALTRYAHIRGAKVYVALNTLVKEGETADMYIERVSYAMARTHRVKVATSDGLEQILIQGHGAARVSAGDLRWELEQVNQQIRTYLQGQQR